MKIGVVGLWHLGIVYSAGFAELGHDVVSYEPDSNQLRYFNQGISRVYEPGLQDMLLKNVNSNKLKFSNDLADFSDIDLFVLAYDTPVDDEDNADSEYVIEQFEKLVVHVCKNAHFLIVSQLPVGSCKKISKILERIDHKGRIVVQPENLRLGKAIETFFNPGRIVAGTADSKPDQIVVDAFKGINAPIVWMHSVSAEVTKHAINAFLATSITFMGELSEICEIVGADAKEVEKGLKTDPRIGMKSYLSPGLGFAGGTLARDVRILSNIQSKLRNDPAIFTSLMESNKCNNAWIGKSLGKILFNRESTRVCFWGISYVENTDTLRRSEIHKYMIKLVNEGHQVSYVENIEIKDDVGKEISNTNSIEESLKNIEVLVVSKKLYDQSNVNQVAQLLSDSQLWILDPSRILLELLPNLLENPRYLTVGKGL
jgi:UDPglucose 6-dehydrogenase